MNGGVSGTEKQVEGLFDGACPRSLGDTMCARVSVCVYEGEGS